MQLARFFLDLARMALCQLLIAVGAAGRTHDTPEGQIYIIIIIIIHAPYLIGDTGTTNARRPSYSLPLDSSPLVLSLLARSGI